MDCFLPPHKQEIIFRTFNKTTPLAKIRSLTEAASVSCLAMFNCTGHQWQGTARGDARPEVVSCPVLVKRSSACTKNGCEQSTASQNLNQRCT